MTRRVLDIGNCALDHSSILELVRSNFDAEVDRAHTLTDALDHLGQHEYAVVLVNRLLDRDGSSGLEVIKSLKEQSPTVPVLMITNFEEHQKSAVAAGAERGFGKRELNSASPVEVLRPYLG